MDPKCPSSGWDSAMHFREEGLGGALCEESYDKSREHIKKQRHHFADKGPNSQSYGFSSGHVWM